MHIIFRKIRFRNFLATGNTFTEIDLDRSPTTMVIGENGAGKSTFLDALAFVLYGKPFRRINKPQLVNSINKKALLVECEFDIGQVHYLVRRGIKPAVFEIYRNGKLLPQDAKAADYQARLTNDILKLGRKSFTQIVVLGSSTFVPFMQLYSHQRREIIEDLLDLQVFSVMNSLLKDRITENQEQVVESQANIRITEERLSMHEQHMQSAVDKAETQIQECEQKIEGYRDRITVVKDAWTKMSEGIKDDGPFLETQEMLLQNLIKLNESRARWERKLKTAQGRVDLFEHNNSCPTCSQQITEQHKDQMLVEARNDLAEAKVMLRKIEKFETSQQQKREENEDKLNDCRIHNASAREQLAAMNSDIDLKKQLITSLEEQIGQLRKQHKEHGDGKKLGALKRSVTAAKKKHEALIIDKYSLSVVATILKDTGIKTKIIKQYIPIMNRLINKYLAAMDFFVQFEIDENFNETIKSRHRDEFSYQSFSEGEKARIDLALLFTWRAVSKVRNSVSMNLLVMDEVFDGSLDSSGIEELLKIIKELTSDQNTFIITHKSDAYADHFDDLLRFEKSKGFSKMVA